MLSCTESNWHDGGAYAMIDAIKVHDDEAVSNDNVVCTLRRRAQSSPRVFECDLALFIVHFTKVTTCRITRGLLIPPFELSRGLDNGLDPKRAVFFRF